MERTGKYEKFPVLQPGDVVICGKHTAYIVTDGGGYKLMESADPKACAALVGYDSSLEHLFTDCDNYYDTQYRPEAVFRPYKGLCIPSATISTALTDWRIVRGTKFERIWSIDDDNAKELTVDQVSSLLGYNVKIVGSGIAD